MSARASASETPGFSRATASSTWLLRELIIAGGNRSGRQSCALRDGNANAAGMTPTTVCG